MPTTTIPEKFLPLLTDKRVLANLGTVMPDGSPQVTPVWFFYRDGKFIVNSARGRVKDRNMKRDPHVAISITDPENIYRHVSLRGRVVHITEEGADAMIDALSKKYTGADTYRGRRAGEVRVTYEIEPTSVATMG
jgi:PPOX class probable F420-dependent enzyme